MNVPVLLEPLFYIAIVILIVVVCFVVVAVDTLRAHATGRAEPTDPRPDAPRPVPRAGAVGGLTSDYPARYARAVREHGQTAVTEDRTLI